MSKHKEELEGLNGEKENVKLEGSTEPKIILRILSDINVTIDIEKVRWPHQTVALEEKRKVR